MLALALAAPELVSDPVPPPAGRRSASAGRGEPRAVTGRHDLVLKASGRFQAGASSLTHFGGNVFRRAVPLEP